MFPNSFVIARISFKNSLEYVCDILSATKVYKKIKDPTKDAYEYFNSHSTTYLMHPANKEFILWCVDEINKYGFKKMKKKYLKKNYELIINKYPISIIIPFDDFSFKYLNII